MRRPGGGLSRPKCRGDDATCRGEGIQLLSTKLGDMPLVRDRKNRRALGAVCVSCVQCVSLPSNTMARRRAPARAHASYVGLCGILIGRRHRQSSMREIIAVSLRAMATSDGLCAAGRGLYDASRIAAARWRACQGCINPITRRMKCHMINVFITPRHAWAHIRNQSTQGGRGARRGRRPTPAAAAPSSNRHPHGASRAPSPPAVDGELCAGASRRRPRRGLTRLKSMSPQSVIIYSVGPLGGGRWKAGDVAGRPW